MSENIYLFLLIVYLFFIGFASFYINTSSDAEVTNRLRQFFLFQFSFHNLRDIATNILLYMPLGLFLSAFHQSRDKPGKRIIFFGLFFGTMVSFIVEIIQSFIGRYSDFMDVISNSAGHAIAYLLLLIAVKQYKLNPKHLLGLNANDKRGVVSSIAGIRFIYVALVIAVSLLPLDISVSLNRLLAQLQPESANVAPRIILDPYYHFSVPASVSHNLFSKLLIFIPLAGMSTWLCIARRINSWFWPVIYCFTLACFMEFSKIFVLSANSDIAIVLLAPVIAFLTSRLVYLGTLSRDKDGIKDEIIDSNQQYLMIFILASISYLVFLSLWSLSPFEFELNAGMLIDKAKNESNIIPFRFHFSDRSIAAAIDIVREFLLYVPFGLLLASLCSQLKVQRKAALLLVAGVSLCITFSLEISQLLVIGRYVDITDPLLGTCGALVGFFLIRMNEYLPTRK